ncbi:VanZ family protein [Haliea atlantica]|jgi:hypothetical protein|nr:hypothetical protein [Haliea sp.]MAL94034.1 hypothetical protein [Haliea sp.]|tara:strand:- start:3679 stop:4083 length:405 start_codon:yes stop_codon:yes gene_type:complete
MTLTHYRLLFAISLGTTLLLLLLPGNCVEALQDLLRALWPWGSRSSLALNNLPTDKLVHGSLFTLCGLLLVKGWRLRGRQWVRPWGLLLLAGTITELLHIALPGRSFEFSDMLANTLGASMGIAIGCRLQSFRG